jgi:hypothetical protein
VLAEVSDGVRVMPLVGHDLLSVVQENRTLTSPLYVPPTPIPLFMVK